jgi:ribosomal protein S12 methylthiotransferase
MGRKGDMKKYLNLVEKIRFVLPESIIRSTFLIGFPSESPADFIFLKKFLQEAQFDWAGFFQYSREENTVAYNMGFPLANFFLAKKTPKRIAELQELQTKITERKLKRFVGKTFEILAEEQIKGENIVLGRGYFNAPDVDGVVIIHSNKIKPGNIVKCKIEMVNNIDLEAYPV